MMPNNSTKYSAGKALTPWTINVLPPFLMCICSAHIARVRINGVKSPILPIVRTGKMKFPCPRSRLTIWSRETGSAIPPRVSLLMHLHTQCVCVRVFFTCTVCVCVFSSHSFCASTSLDVPAGVTQEEGHTGFFIHLLSAVRALIFLARRS